MGLGQIPKVWRKRPGDGHSRSPNQSGQGASCLPHRNLSSHRRTGPPPSVQQPVTSRFACWRVRGAGQVDGATQVPRLLRQCLAFNDGKQCRARSVSDPFPYIKNCLPLFLTCSARLEPTPGVSRTRRRPYARPSSRATTMWVVGSGDRWRTRRTIA